QDLKDYYKGQSFDLKNIGGYKEGNKVTFIYHNQQIDVTLTGNEKLEFNDDGEISNVDVFVVRENSDRS
ncbi:superantigen-like protein, partial [Staphylococcus aureus]|nr:superantigen-like protein [Staphylococcus aureus]